MPKFIFINNKPLAHNMTGNVTTAPKDSVLHLLELGKEYEGEIIYGYTTNGRLIKGVKIPFLGLGKKGFDAQRFTQID